MRRSVSQEAPSIVYSLRAFREYKTHSEWSLLFATAYEPNGNAMINLHLSMSISISWLRTNEKHTNGVLTMQIFLSRLCTDVQNIFSHVRHVNMNMRIRSRLSQNTTTRKEKEYTRVLSTEIERKILLRSFKKTTNLNLAP